MSSTYSPDLRIELIANGEQSGYWGTTTNNNLGTLIEEAIAKTVFPTLTSAAPWFVATNGVSDTARCAAVDVAVNGTITGDFTAYIPPAPKLYVIKNSTAYTMTLRNATAVNSSTSAGGTTVAIPAGKTVIVRSDGTNVTFQFNHIPNDLSVTGALTITGASTISGNAAFGTRVAGTYTQTGTTVTVTTGSVHGYVNGETVAFINISGLGVSGSYVITYVSTTVFTFTSGVSQSTSGSCSTTNDAITLNGIVQPGVIIEGSSSGATLRVTQTGTGNAFVVDDSADPDITPFVINAAGNVGIGLASPTQLLDIASDSVAIEQISRYSTDTSAPARIVRKARGTTAAPTIVVSGDSTGTVSFQAYDGAAFQPTAAITSAVDGTPAAGDMPGRLSLSTVLDGTATLVERVRIDNAGNTILGSGEAGATPVGNTLRAPNAAGTDKSGSNLVIQAGNSTGTGTSGYVSIQTSNPSTTGSTANTLIDRLKVQANGLMLGQYSTMGAGVVPSESFYQLSSDFVGTASVTTAQTLFGVGITLAANTTYAFEMVFALTKTASATSHTLSLAYDIGSGTISSTTYQVLGSAANSTTISAVTTPDAFSVIQTASATAVTTAIASSAASYIGKVVGTVSVGTSGKFTPQYKTSASVAGAYTTVAGSFIRIYPVATGSSVNVGGWA